MPPSCDPHNHSVSLYQEWTRHIPSCEKILRLKKKIVLKIEFKNQFCKRSAIMEIVEGLYRIWWSSWHRPWIQKVVWKITTTIRLPSYARSCNSLAAENPVSSLQYCRPTLRPFGISAYLVRTILEVFNQKGQSISAEIPAMGDIRTCMVLLLASNDLNVPEVCIWSRVALVTYIEKTALPSHAKPSDRHRKGRGGGYAMGQFIFKRIILFCISSSPPDHTGVLLPILSGTTLSCGRVCIHTVCIYCTIHKPGINGMSLAAAMDSFDCPVAPVPYLINKPCSWDLQHVNLFEAGSLFYSSVLLF